MITLADALQIALLVSVIHMSAYYLLSLVKRDASVVDIGWGLGFVLIAWILWGSATEKSLGLNLMVLFVSIWGIRLAWHITNRKLKAGNVEDWRYQTRREAWGRQFVGRSYFQIFLLQALLMVVIAMPILVAATNHADFDASIWLGVGSLVWLAGFYFEAVGDGQLAKFIAKKNIRKKQAKGKQFMTSGLWAYTRHPNYFGEVIQWWGLFVMTAGLSNFWWAVLSPLTITFLLLKVTGIPMLEGKYAGDKEFEKYRRRTNAFFPGPRRK